MKGITYLFDRYQTKGSKLGGNLMSRCSWSHQRTKCLLLIDDEVNFIM